MWTVLLAMLVHEQQPLVAPSLCWSVVVDITGPHREPHDAACAATADFELAASHALTRRRTWSPDTTIKPKGSGTIFRQIESPQAGYPTPLTGVHTRPIPLVSS